MPIVANDLGFPSAQLQVGSQKKNHGPHAHVDFFTMVEDVMTCNTGKSSTLHKSFRELQELSNSTQAHSGSTTKFPSLTCVQQGGL